MSNLILSVDPGFSATGIAVMQQNESGEWAPILLKCIRSKPSDAKRDIFKAADDVDRIQRMSAEIMEIIKRVGIKRMVVELPHGGAQSSRACRAMAMASAMMGVIAEALNMAVEFYTPRDTRMAAGVPPSVRKGNEVKSLVMAEMCKRYPSIWDIKLKAEMEHIADALATFEAARRGNFVRSSV